ncbi:MAG: MBL fold metallo-hydrolase [Myxococcota bacterium]|jgi:glyoxylase-like metal-dependent hydrolase (beta-lactamase superfamily II)|nr:MBL fold metallo-hydrolase [Myxococcota bacterium]
MPLKYQVVVNGPFQENCYIAWDEGTRKGVLIDPGDEPQVILAAAQKLGVTIEAIYNTHAHIDHAGAVATIQSQLKVPFALHEEDEPLLDGLSVQARLFGLPPIKTPKADRRLRHGDTVKIGDIEGTVIHTPGHTPGGICFLFDKLVFVGDTLFAGSIGRTDLPGGSHEKLLAGIKRELLSLPDDTVVLCGHGPATTIGLEKKHNPFVGHGAY